MQEVVDHGLGLMRGRVQMRRADKGGRELLFEDADGLDAGGAHARAGHAARRVARCVLEARDPIAVPVGFTFITKAS